MTMCRICSLLCITSLDSPFRLVALSDHFPTRVCYLELTGESSNFLTIRTEHSHASSKGRVVVATELAK